MKTAIIGLMQSGKSTLVSAISGREPAPLGTVNINETIVPVPDERVDWLSEHYTSKKTTYATIDCLDVPGFNFADNHGRAAARRHLQQIRTVDLLVLVLRAFNDPSVPAYGNKVDPVRDLEDFKTELLLADLELVEKRIEGLEKQTKKPTKSQSHDKAELALQLKLRETIEQEKPLSEAIETEAEREMVKSLGFLTQKPMVVAINVDEDQLETKFDFSSIISESTPVVYIAAKLERELSQLDQESRTEFMNDMGITESAISKFVNSCYSAIGLISFLTAGTPESRAWPIEKGTTAHDAAGKIHSDIKRGFIRAETMSLSDLKELGDEKAVKAAGKARLEGKDYVVKDGDIILFRFNV